MSYWVRPTVHLSQCLIVAEIDALEGGCIELDASRVIYPYSLPSLASTIIGLDVPAVLFTSY